MSIADSLAGVFLEVVPDLDLDLDDLDGRTLRNGRSVRNGNIKKVAKGETGAKGKVAKGKVAVDVDVVQADTGDGDGGGGGDGDDGGGDGGGGDGGGGDGVLLDPSLALSMAPSTIWVAHDEGAVTCK